MSTSAHRKLYKKVVSVVVPASKGGLAIRMKEDLCNTSIGKFVGDVAIIPLPTVAFGQNLTEKICERLVNHQQQCGGVFACASSSQCSGSLAMQPVGKPNAPVSTLLLGLLRVAPTVIPLASRVESHRSEFWKIINDVVWSRCPPVFPSTAELVETPMT